LLTKRQSCPPGTGICKNGRTCCQLGGYCCNNGELTPEILRGSSC
jgi:hypothetical protein